MTASTFELRFARSHIRESFGEIPSLVFQFIFRHGSPSLQDIVENIGFSLSDCRKAVFILLKHFCISSAVHKGFSKRSSKSYIVYVTELQNIYRRLSFPHFVQSVLPCAEQCGRSMRVQLVKLLLQHGSASEDKMIEIFPQHGFKDASNDVIRKCMDDLKRDAYFDNFTCPLLEEFPAKIPKESRRTGEANYKTAGQSQSHIQNSSPQPLTINFECCNKRYLTKIKEIFISRYSIIAPSTEELTATSTEELTAKIIELVVKNRFGSSAGRIFQLLFLSRQLEQKQIAEIAMLPLKDTREILYKLLQHGYIYLQEVSKSSDHAPSRTIYLWKVDLTRVKEEIIADTNKKILNIQSRLYLNFVSLNEKATFSFSQNIGKDLVREGPESKVLDIIALELHELASLLNS